MTRNAGHGCRPATIVRRLSIVVVGASLGAAFACGGSKSAAPTPPPVGVEVVEVKAGDVPIFSDFVGQTFAREQVEVRGRVTGYIEKRLFDPGSEVKKGQVLYVLDRRPYQAQVLKAKAGVANSNANLTFAKEQVELIEAQAQLAEAEANLIRAKNDVDRLGPLVQQEAAPKQDLDNAVQNQAAMQATYDAKKANVDQKRLTTKVRIEAADADVAASEATLDSAQLDLDYATITAPISGRIGDSKLDVGALVTSNSAEALTTIVPLDEIWVKFQVSEQEMLMFKRRFQSGMQLEANRPKDLELVLADGTVFVHKGRVTNTVNQVSATTGTLEIQAVFPNPEKLLLPGQFVRVKAQTDVRPNTILIPQRAVQEMQGLRSVFSLDGDNKVIQRSIMTGERVGDQWVVEQGLKPGEKVIVEGIQKVRPGVAVTPTPYVAPAAEKAPPSGAAEAAPETGTPSGTEDATKDEGEKDKKKDHKDKKKSDKAEKEG